MDRMTIRDVIRAIKVVQGVLLCVLTVCNVYIMVQCNDCNKLPTEASIFIALAVVDLFGVITTICRVEQMIQMQEKAIGFQSVFAALITSNLVYLRYRKDNIESQIGETVFIAEVVSLVLYLVLFAVEVFLLLRTPSPHQNRD